MVTCPAIHRTLICKSYRVGNMPVNAVAENVLGTVGKKPLCLNWNGDAYSSRVLPGTVCWMTQLLPQVWKSWKDKSTEGLSHYLG